MIFFNNILFGASR